MPPSRKSLIALITCLAAAIWLTSAVLGRGTGDHKTLQANAGATRTRRWKFYVLLIVPIVPILGMTWFTVAEFEKKEGACSTTNTSLSPEFLEARDEVERRRQATDEAVAKIEKRAAQHKPLRAANALKAIRLGDAEDEARATMRAAQSVSQMDSEDECDLGQEVVVLESLPLAAFLYLLALLGSASMALPRTGSSSPIGSRLGADLSQIRSATIVVLLAALTLAPGWYIAGGPTATFLIYAYGVVTTAALALTSFD